MTTQQKRVLKGASLALVLIQGIGLLYAVSLLRSVQGFGMTDLAYGPTLLGAAVWPLLVGSAVFFSLRALFRESHSHYGWMGLIAISGLTLPSLCLPASAVLLYVLLSPTVRGPMLKKIDTEWGLSENQ